MPHLLRAGSLHLRDVLKGVLQNVAVRLYDGQLQDHNKEGMSLMCGVSVARKQVLDLQSSGVTVDGGQVEPQASAQQRS